MSTILQDNFWFSDGNPVFEIGQSLRFRGAQYLQKTITGANTNTQTFSFWMKAAKPDTFSVILSRPAFAGSSESYIGYGASGFGQQFYYWNGATGSSTNNVGRLQRDPSAWYNVVLRVQPSGSTVWVNNVFQGSDSNAYTLLVSGNTMSIGRWTSIAQSTYLEGYLAEINAIDGYAYDPTAFGEYNDDGVWVPIKAPDVNYGPLGFHLDFADPNNIGKDISGSGNDFTATGFNFVDSYEGGNYLYGSDLVSDSPTDNFFPYNPLNDNFLTNDGTANAYAFSGVNAGYSGLQQLGPSTGGRYVITGVGGGGSSFTRISANNFYVTRPTSQGSGILFQVGWYEVGASNFYTHTIAPAGAVYSSALSSGSFTEQVGWVAVVDEPSGKYWLAYYLNNDPTTITYVDASVVANPTANPNTGTSPTGTFTPGAQLYYDTGTGTTNPTGPAIIAPYQSHESFVPQIPNVTTFSYLNNSKRLRTVPIPNPSNYFDVVTDTGANILTAAQSKFSNGLYLIIDQVNAYERQFVDTSRGVSNALWSPTGQSTTYTPSSGTSLAYCWATPGNVVTNNNGSISSQVDANTTSGFSIVEWTMGSGTQTIGHGLTQAPDVVVVKSTTTTNNFWVYIRDMGSNSYWALNTYQATTTGSWGGDSTSSVFYVSNLFALNGDDMIAYCWHGVPGFSQFGHYQSNGTTDGAFVYTGFTPKCMIIDALNDATQNATWTINAPSDYNPLTRASAFPQNLAPASGYDMDCNANGFKIRNANTGNGGSSIFDYFYMAFAEHPFGGSNVVPATAR